MKIKTSILSNYIYKKGCFCEALFKNKTIPVFKGNSTESLKDPIGNITDTKIDAYGNMEGSMEIKDSEIIRSVKNNLLIAVPCGVGKIKMENGIREITEFDICSVNLVPSTMGTT